MSDKKEKTTAEVVEKKKKDVPAKKKEKSSKNIGATIKKFFKDFKGECKKVTWPSGKTVVNNSLVVIVVVASHASSNYGYNDYNRNCGNNCNKFLVHVL